MLWQRIRIALLTGALVAMTGLVALGGEEDKDKPKAEPIGPPAGAKVAAPPAHTCTIWVNEMVQEQYPCTRTVYTKECRTEEYTAYKTECIPEVRTHMVTTYKKVCETVNEMRTLCENVNVCEERTVMKTCTVCKPVVHVTRKCEDHGHYECKEVPCGPSLSERLHKTFHHNDCCDPCNPCCEVVKTKTVKCWVPCPVWVEKCCTKMERVTECHPEVVHVNVCKKVYKTVVVPVTCVKCVPECHEEKCTVMVSRCVPCKATRQVEVCVPHTETFMATRCVCKKVAKEVPVVETCCESPCCDTCDSCEGHHKFKLFGGH